MAEYNGNSGVWRTVGGRRIFIKDGQDLPSAMIESGKFPSAKPSSGAPQKRRASQELHDRTKSIDTMLDGYCDKESTWSGVVNIDETIKAVGRKEWNCDITWEQENASNADIIHELLHARSALHFKPEEFANNAGFEEGVAELYAQEIAIRQGYVPSDNYYELVGRLRDINSFAGIYSNDYEFARALFNIDLPKRSQWLDDKILYAVVQNNRLNDYSKILDLYNYINAWRVK